MTQNVSHIISTLVHLVIVTISSVLIYYGSGFNGVDGLLIIFHSILLLFLVWIWLCFVCNCGCEKKKVLENDHTSNDDEMDLEEVEGLDHEYDCKMFQPMVFGSLMIVSGVILLFATVAPETRGVVITLSWAHLILLFVAFILSHFYLRNILWITPTPPIFFIIIAMECRKIKVRRGMSDFDIYEREKIIPLRVYEKYGSYRSFIKDYQKFCTNRQNLCIV